MPNNEVTEAHVPTRDEIRASIFASKKPMSKEVVFFGQKIELRQPILEDILTAQNGDDRKSAIVDTLVKYAFVPDTDLHVFEDADADAIMKLPFGQDMVNITNALEELTTVNFQDGKSISSSTQPG